MAAGETVTRGRDAERQVVRGVLRRAMGGLGGVLLVEGEPGAGKSRLLRDATDEAAEQGFALAAGAADPLGRAIPFFALRVALRDQFAWLAAGGDDRGPPDAVASWISQIRAHLEQRARAAPVLVCLDDLHWAGPATLAALRSLPWDLRRSPVAWILARSSAAQSYPGDTEYLFGLLEKDGAARIIVAALANEAVAGMLADAFGAPADQALLDLAGGAAGNPSLLTELIRGLRDDSAVRVSGGRAVLVSARLPRRIHQVVRRRLDGLSGHARNLLVTATVLGSSFRLEDAAEMLGETPAMLVPAVEEAMGAGIMAAAHDSFSFRQQLLRRAVGDVIPRPVSNALHRQYGRLLLDRGESAALAAGHLLRAAHPDDHGSLADLDQAAAQTLGTAPRIAANLASRALELTPPGDQGALARAVAAAEALAAAGRLDRAAQIARDTLIAPLPAVCEARLRCALSSVLYARGQATAALAEARTVLTQRQLPDALRDQALTAQLQALAGSRGWGAEPGEAGPVSDAILAAPGRHADHAVAAALVTRAFLAWDKGQVGTGLELLRDAARRGGGSSPDARHVQPLLALAAALIDLRRLEEAENILRAADNQTPRGIQAEAAVPILRARIHLARGRLAAAAAAGQAALAAADTAGAHGYAATARRVLAVIALRAGDTAAAAHHIAGQPSGPTAMPHLPGLFARAETTMAQAQVTQARHGPAAAIGQIRQACDGLPTHRGVFLGDPALAAWVVRAALAAGAAELAALAARTAEVLARDNPGHPALTAGAAHSTGLAGKDPARLARAAAEHTDPWAGASAAEDLAVLHMEQSDHHQAIQHLERAIRGYQQAGAATDAARVRHRLRALGVRRRHWTQQAGRPLSGWQSLTDTERTASELVAQGLSNKQVAAQMYISVNTVAFHLRQIFRKLHIGSRLELARIVMQQAQPM
jgi:DNA-binding CsgD family transcriptional regulator